MRDIEDDGAVTSIHGGADLSKANYGATVSFSWKPKNCIIKYSD